MRPNCLLTMPVPQAAFRIRGQGRNGARRSHPRVQAAIAPVLTLVGLGLSLAAGPAGAEPPDLLAEAEVQAVLRPAPPPAPGSETDADEPANAPAGTTPVSVRFAFDVFNREEFAALEIETGLLPDAEWRLNGRVLPPPVRGLTYARIPGVRTSHLQDGPNVLEASGDLRLPGPEGESPADRLAEAAAGRLGVALRGLRAGDLAFRRGPILVCSSPTSLVVNCQLNMRAPLVLHLGGQEIASRPGLHHQLEARGLAPDQDYDYILTASLPDEGVSVTAGPFPVRTPPESGPIRLALVGDPGAHPNTWARTAAAVLAARPHAVILAGDVVRDGRRDADWDVQFLEPAAALLRAIPVLAVPGRLANDSPLFALLLGAPGRPKNWTLTLGPVQIIGIDGNLKWAPDNLHGQWLDRTLAAAQAPFLFLATHYPAWTTAPRDAEDGDDPLARDALRRAREVLHPLLARYHATAMLAAHTRAYERVEPDAGPCVIASGGTGALTETRVTDGPPPSPASLPPGSHYVLLEADENACLLRACGLDGRVFDTRAWDPRDRALSPVTGQSRNQLRENPAAQTAPPLPARDPMPILPGSR